MRQIPADKIMLYGITVIVAVAMTPWLHKIPRTKGRYVPVQLAYLAFVVGMLGLVPEWVQDELFSPAGVLLVGTLMPMYSSIVAAVSTDADDDLAWLQFWVASSAFNFATEFMDEITAQLPQAGEHWYEFEFFFTLWLVFPLTDGSGFMYEYITKPFLTPVAQKLKTQLEGYVGIILTVVNTSYLWIVWFCFVRLPEEQRRFLVVGLGTVYPIASSIVAISSGDSKNGTNTSENQKKKTSEAARFWLVYWATYSILFIAMDYLENFVGHIIGFYSLCAMATLYLFLPMFQGADVIFRRVLVPLSGQYENLLLHDAYLVRIGMEESIPEQHRERVLAKASDLFKASSSKKNT
ncbi:hypothetical protein ACA910_002153 [Epithemia clementina (nom. ined.)]